MLLRKVDVCIVTTLRPEILQKTLESFVSRVKTENQFQAIVNIDYVPDENIKFRHAIIPLIEKYLPLKLAIHSRYPSFSQAVINVWKNSSAKYVFHLEDDWEFVRDINLDWCIDRIESKQYDYIRFSKRRCPIAEESEKIALLPSLWKGSAVREFSRHMSNKYDPEKQLRKGQGNQGIDAALPEKILDYPGGLCVRDIGREWRESRNIRKWKKGEDIKWQED